MREKETLWIVGDIHGMYDPLKRLITELRRRQILNGEKIRKLIFIGDYIDYGPSSKEVLDLLMSLRFNTLFLAGNHEDLLLHYCKRSAFYEEYGNMWFNGNGGQDTVLSFNPDPEVYKKVQLHPDDSSFPEHSRDFETGDYEFKKKYMDFFSKLVYVHTEEIENNGKPLKLVFSHAGLSASRDLDEQLKLKTFDDFHGYCRENNIYEKNFNLWSREEPQKKFGDYVLIHGHTPIEILPDYYKNLGKYKPESGLPYLRFLKPEVRVGYEDYSSRYYFDGTFEDLISIDIDTGAAFGKYLTAVGFSPGVLWDKGVKVLQVATSGIHRGRKADVRSFELKINPFGDTARRL